MSGKLWSKEDETYLCENYTKLSAKHIAAKLDKTINAVQSKLSRLKLANTITKDYLVNLNRDIQIKYPYLEFLVYNGSRNNSTIRNTICLHEWEVRPDYVKNRGIGIKCPICNPSNRKKTNESLLKEIIAKGYTEIISVQGYVSSKSDITVTYKCGHIDTTSSSDLLNKAAKSVCRLCTPQNTNAKSAEQFMKEFNIIAPKLDLLDLYENDYTYLNVYSKECDHSWRINPHNFLQKGTLAECPTCYPKYSKWEKSAGEQELLNWIGSIYTGTIIASNRTILNGLEIDIYLPELNLGIEYNGEYWHSTEHKDKHYHQEKSDLANTKGIQLIQIFEHEWRLKNLIVKSRLKSMLGANSSFGARLFKIKYIPFPKDFLNANHIQGAGSTTSINAGLFMQDELAAVMTFGTPRFDRTYQYGLIRFCTLLDINIPGGASKLFLSFLNTYKPTSIISYSDKCWSTGSLYKQLNFKHIRTTEPGYFYFKGTNIVNRYSTQKSKLKRMFPKIYSDELTETEIMYRAGFGKVYNAGKDVWGFTSAPLY